MGMIINTNMASINAQRYLNTNSSKLNRSLERLSSGFRINRSSDDAAGLSISETLRAQIRGTSKALDNVQDGINVLSIMDGAMSTITENLQRMRELAVQAANDTLGTNQRNAIEEEMDQLALNITQISNSTQFNGVNLLTGSATTFNIQLGTNGTNGTDSLNLTSAAGTNPFATISAAALTVDDANILVATTTNSQSSIATIDAALTTVNNRRAALGALSNRLSSAAEALTVRRENLSASESRIRNVDVAAESAEMIRFQILQQASTTILAQANQKPQLALSLLQ